MKFRNYIHLLVFPLLQLTFYMVFAFTIDQTYWAFLWILLAALFLNFTLHISIHYVVHFPIQNKIFAPIFGLILTAFLGLPFHYYEMSHWNHHRYNNSLDDFTTTWRKNKLGQIVPKPFFIYILFWLVVPPGELNKQFETAIQEGYCSKGKQQLSSLEFVFNMLLWGLLAYLSVFLLLGYLVMIYIAWVLISAQNYGQHMPDLYQKFKGYSFYARWYNFIFVNNGLHKEHHDQPELSYWQLSDKKTDGAVDQPHLLAGLFLNKKRKQ
jgi:fatty acid desaturase